MEGCPSPGHHRQDGSCSLGIWELLQLPKPYFPPRGVLVFLLAYIAFANSHGEVHLIPKKGKGLQSGCWAYFACKGQFVGINTAHLECDLAHEVIQKMQYEEES